MEIEHILGSLVGALVGATVYHLLMARRFERREEAQRLQLDVEAREAQLKWREEKSTLELEYKNKEAELERSFTLRKDEQDLRARELARANERHTERVAKLEEKEKDLVRASRNLEDSEHEAEKTRRLYRLKLHQISQMDQVEARKLLIAATERECEKEIRDLRQSLLKRSDAEMAEESRRIVLAAMQRITSQPMNDATATVVTLPSEEMKGRIIGREGRNIRTFEHATGTTLMIDETPDSVLISCFDPVRREIARIALDALLRDGRIHPASIEEEVEKAEETMNANVIELGEGALRKLRLTDVHPDVVALLGKLHYRLSNNQNTLAHSVEVANLCALIAAEIGLDPVLAKRAGLFHDLGKAVDEDYEGSHAAVGADIIKQHGEDPRVVNAAAAHHKEVPAESAYAGLVMVADSLSAVRPGARASSIDGFIQRVRSIEDIAKQQSGVSDAYAIQAGREVRVIVEPMKVDEDEARKIALRIREQIEDELNYPGAIEITVIREQRFTETAV
ncbi:MULTISPECIES: ribonuclease Y [unclassified Lentimonas]|uniref:ribonuclease Y n=1 Tax=unclassified Lentimonas TaxID=2630993 RepID=UPI001325EA83|nr:MULTISPECIES: ribonuclease Y [unclassified Lentimonas]CAA6676579.1 FIG002344: Hydrolase (HAD superfamily) [Lentimonas sp. CC4]CAA6684757.1 FIG002344: Hydrolase (HAD superfamily) [Lentimonas sp. CC6]CAA6692039.1 FIG002344: Hydrolase (HAD superfamily) [Lentimonas sp. CC10]CAA6694028.1 FIG002344: Hydrolase (HAD superfamily) [Lentimonas sp. CC19]CAA7070276.1 FIG002344: Hydrolase (HAD superfamily) [Lentimonas sp. CC11]